jgi:uncharacterized protein (TIGR03663 family)
MHADEANQAVKLGELIDAGHYAFDPRDHHGPTLYFAGWPLAWLRGERSLAALSETTVRLVPAIFGTLSTVLLALLVLAGGRRDAGSPRATAEVYWHALAAAAFLAVSPPAVYYSRYFIQETLLATFTLAAFLAAWRWWQTGRARWAVAAGISMGLMQATKASAPLFLVFGVVGFVGSRFGRRDEANESPGPPASPRQPGRAVLFALGAGAVTAALLYSSFGTNPAGLRDAFAVYTNAATRFGAAAAPTGHEKPWWYYLRIFGWHREGGLLWHQAAFSALAVSGFVVAWVRRERLLRAAAIYAALVAGAFSVFAYKTPWHTVHFVPPMAILAGAALTGIARLRTGRPVAAAFALITLATLYQQTWRTSFLRAADQRNPYAYVHSSPDVLKLRPLAEAALAAAPNQPIRVISEEYWPIPWYLRGLPQVGYWPRAPEVCDGALILASAAEAEAVRAQLHGRYRESFVGLRPGVLFIVFTPEP